MIRPDLRGFGESDPARAPPRPTRPTARPPAHGLIEELALDRPVIAGYDIGSRIAQAIARDRPDLVRALVLSPPCPGSASASSSPARRPVLVPALPPARPLRAPDRRQPGRRARLPRALLGALERPSWTPPGGPPRPLTELYAPPGAFVTSISWYRAGPGRSLARSPGARPEHRLAVPTTVLWPEHDPLFAFEWSRPPGRVLRRRRPAPHAGRRALQPARGPRTWSPRRSASG